MLALVEPFFLKGLADRPDLGCAMLIAACREHRIETTLIKGQTRWLKDLFLQDSGEIFDLILNLNDSALTQLRLRDYQEAIAAAGRSAFQREVAQLYKSIFFDKSPRAYYIAEKFEKLGELTRIFLSVYTYYLTECGDEEIGLVRRTVTEIIKAAPRFIGFSLQLKFDPITRAVRNQLKQLTDAPIIIGGSLTPFLDPAALAPLFQTQHFDYLVKGEGEISLPRLLRALEQGRDPTDQPNVFFMKKGRLMGLESEKHGPGAVKKDAFPDLDRLPYPDFSQFDLDLYPSPLRILPMQTARGCSWNKCAFCSHSAIYGNTCRRLSSQRTAAMLRHLKSRYNCSHFAFHDDELPAAWARRLSEAIISERLEGVSLYTYARLTDGYTDKTLLAGMRKAGFRTICWGLESGSQRVLDLMNKGATLATMNTVLKNSAEQGLTNLCFLLFGFPGETLAEARQTIAFIEANAAYISHVIPHRFSVAPHSAVAKNPAKWGLHQIGPDRYSGGEGMSREELKRFYKYFTGQWEINETRNTVGGLKYLPPASNSRMLLFLTASHGLLSGRDSSEQIKAGDLKALYPLIPGALAEDRDGCRLMTVDAARTLTMNRLFSPKARRLDAVERRCFELADGRFSIHEIIRTITDEKDVGDDAGRMPETCIAFLKELLKENKALGFTKSWRS